MAALVQQRTRKLCRFEMRLKPSRQRYKIRSAMGFPRRLPNVFLRIEIETARRKTNPFQTRVRRQNRTDTLALTFQSRIQRFQSLRNANCLRPIRVVEHQPNRPVSRRSKGLQARRLFRNGIAVGCGVPPFDLYGFAGRKQTAYPKRLRANAKRIFDSGRAESGNRSRKQSFAARSRNAPAY